MSKEVPFIKPKLPSAEELTEDLQRIRANNYYSNSGPVYHEFKEEIEKYLGQDLTAVMVSNATLGLMLAIKAIMGKTRAKKYVAIPSFTFAAGPLAIKWCGLEPLFFDVDAKTTQPHPEHIKEILKNYGDELAGVVLLNNFGIGNESLHEWEELLGSKKIPFIIDSAAGFGSTYSNSNLLGGEGVCEIFSFHATKPFGIGEGGLITTKDKKLAHQLEAMKNFGFNQEKETEFFGMNAKITELDCAIALRILEKFPDTLTDRRRTYKRYKSHLRSKKVAFLPGAEKAAIQFATILVDPTKRDLIIETLKKNKIEARTYYAPAVNTFSLFKDCPSSDLTNTVELSKRVISLPVHPDMEPEVVDRICGIIKEVL